MSEASLWMAPGFPIMTDEEGAISGSRNLGFKIEEGSAFLRVDDQSKWLRITSDREWKTTQELFEALKAHEPKIGPNGNKHPFKP